MKTCNIETVERLLLRKMKCLEKIAVEVLETHFKIPFLDEMDTEFCTFLHKSYKKQINRYMYLISAKKDIKSKRCK